jgi:phage baseplate assembly protein W
METQRNLIGNGVLFPIKLTNSDNGVGWYPVKEDPNLIKHNLITLISYNIGSRFRQEYYGTKIWSLLEEPALPILFYLANKFISESIDTWEPRISFSNISGSLEGDRIVLNLSYILSGTTTVENLKLEFNNLNT